MPVIDGNTFTIGCDPEGWLLNARTRTPVGAHGYVPGTKKEPYKFRHGGAVQVDGLALEFNIVPAVSEEAWVTNIKRTLKSIRGTPSLKGLDIDFSPTQKFSEEVLDNTPTELLVLGCEPELDAYSDGMARPAPMLADPYMRTAGGHIHIGWNMTDDWQSDNHFHACLTLTQQLDTYLGMASLEWDKDRERRALYGAPGSFRVKPYGVEYRTLSNAWLQSEETVRQVFKLTEEAIRDLLETGTVKDFGCFARKILSEQRV